MVPKIKKLTP